MNYVADLLEMPRMRVYEVVTFYTMFNRFGHLFTFSFVLHLYSVAFKLSNTRLMLISICGGWGRGEQGLAGLKIVTYDDFSPIS